MKKTDSIVLIKEHDKGSDELTTGVIYASSIDYENPDGLIGYEINVHLHDENGNPIERKGVLVEVLE